MWGGGGNLSWGSRLENLGGHETQLWVGLVVTRVGVLVCGLRETFNYCLLAKSNCHGTFLFSMDVRFMRTSVVWFVAVKNVWCLHMAKLDLWLDVVVVLNWKICTRSNTVSGGCVRGFISSDMCS